MCHPPQKKGGFIIIFLILEHFVTAQLETEKISEKWNIDESLMQFEVVIFAAVRQQVQLTASY